MKLILRCQMLCIPPSILTLRQSILIKPQIHRWPCGPHCNNRRTIQNVSLNSCSMLLLQLLFHVTVWIHTGARARDKAGDTSSHPHCCTLRRNRCLTNSEGLIAAGDRPAHARWMQPNWLSTKTSPFLHLSSQMLNEPTATPTIPPHFLCSVSSQLEDSRRWCSDSQPDHNVTSACRISARAEPIDCVLSFVCPEGCLKRCFPGAMMEKPGMVLLQILWQIRRNSPRARVPVGTSSRWALWATNLTAQLGSGQRAQPEMWLWSIFLPRCS